MNWLQKNQVIVILEGSWGLNLCQNSPKMIPNTIQKPSWVDALTILKEFTKSIGSEILSGLGGNTTNAPEIITAKIIGIIIEMCLTALNL